MDFTKFWCSPEISGEQCRKFPKTNLLCKIVPSNCRMFSDGFHKFSGRSRRTLHVLLAVSLGIRSAINFCSLPSLAVSSCRINSNNINNRAVATRCFQQRQPFPHHSWQTWVFLALSSVSSVNCFNRINPKPIPLLSTTTTLSSSLMTDVSVSRVVVSNPLNTTLWWLCFHQYQRYGPTANGDLHSWVFIFVLHLFFSSSKLFTVLQDRRECFSRCRYCRLSTVLV